MTWNDLITSSLRLIGQLGPGRRYGASELEDAQTVCNSLFDQWNTEYPNLFGTRADLYTLVANQQSYQIGPTAADFVATRPERIERANFLFSTSPVIRRPLVLLDYDQWANKRLQAIYTIPAELYCNYDSPNATLFFYPIPDAAYQIELYTWQLLPQIASFTAAVTLPPGYQDAFRYELAERLALEWTAANRAVKMSPQVPIMAARLKASIQSVNSRTPCLRTEPGLSGRRTDGLGGNYNRFTGLVE